MKEYGYSQAEIDAMTSTGAVLCYSGKPAPESVLTPTQGPGWPQSTARHDR
jgi:predicted histidine transporter YuiF (NhaC family)